VKKVVFILLAAVVSFQAHSSAQTANSAQSDNSAQPENAAQVSEAKILKVRPLPLSSVRLTGGPLKHAQDLDAAYLLELEPDRMLAFLRQRAGTGPQPAAGPELLGQRLVEEARFIPAGRPPPPFTPTGNDLRQSAVTKG
jgi:hypothetical protein